MEKWQEQINNSQSLEQLDRIYKEVIQEIESNEYDLELLESELDTVRKTYHQMCEKSDSLRAEIREKKSLFAKIEVQRNCIKESLDRQEQEQRRRERALWSEAQWHNEIEKLKKDGFPESDGEILQLLDAYSHITAAEEDILSVMSLLSAYNTNRYLYAPFWIRKEGRGTPHRISASDYEFVMNDVEASENSIEFWADEHYYYLKMDFNCGCDDHCIDYYNGQSCEKLSIKLIKENGPVIAYDVENNIIAVDRSRCPWNSILLFDFSVLTCCWKSYSPKCESAPMTMVFAPCYLQKNFARDYVRSRRVLDEIIYHLDESDDSIEIITKACLEQVKVDTDIIMLDLNFRGQLFYITIDTEQIHIKAAGTEVSDDMFLSEYEDAFEVYVALARYFDEVEQSEKNRN